MRHPNVKDLVFQWAKKEPEMLLDSSSKGPEDQLIAWLPLCLWCLWTLQSMEQALNEDADKMLNVSEADSRAPASVFMNVSLGQPLGM